MYQVFRNKRTILKKATFPTYEKARQALRKYIRQMVNAKKFSQEDFDTTTSGSMSFWDSVSRQPVNFTRAGFTIRKVA